MMHEFRPGDIIPDSGVYRIRHHPQQAEMPGQLTLIRGHLFPTCGCSDTRFTLDLAAKHPREIRRFAEALAEEQQPCVPAMAAGG